MTDVSVLSVLTRAYTEQRYVLERSKQEARRWGGHSDWPWNGMVLSAATRGGSWRWGKKIEPIYATHLAWPVIASLSDTARHSRLITVGRFPNRTATWLEGVFQHLNAIGGPSGVKTQLASMETTAVIDYWMAIPGLGPKYARNMMMDIYDERFRNGYFAIDSRIINLLPRLGYVGRNRYGEQEEFLCGIAAALAIETWELDRLLYQRANDLIIWLRNGG